MDLNIPYKFKATSGFVIVARQQFNRHSALEMVPQGSESVLECWVIEIIEKRLV